MVKQKIITIHKSGDYWYWRIKRENISSRCLLEYTKLIKKGYEVIIEGEESQ